MLAEKGVELKAIMNCVGHNDPNTMLSIYTHVTEAMQEKMRECKIVCVNRLLHKSNLSLILG